MPIDIPQALLLGQFVDASYNPTVTTPISFVLPSGYTLVDVIEGNDLATDIKSVKGIVPFGFIARSPAPANDFIVAIRGTEGIWEWVQDARFLTVPCPFADGAGETEDGFTAVYQSLTAVSAGTSVVSALKSLLAPIAGATLTITGHSLGASLATLLALDVVENGAFATPAVTTFASPLVGDAQFARVYDNLVPNTWRIVNAVDLVPKVPFPSPWGYVHVNQPYPVNSFGKTKPTLLCAHTLSTYQYLLDSSNGGTTFKVRSDCVGMGLGFGLAI